MKRYLISGTNTDVGKTYFSALFARTLVQQGKRVKYVKPVQTGCPPDDDAAFVRSFAGLSPEDVEVYFTAEEPVAPYVAFPALPFNEIVDRLNSVEGYDVLLVEGAGGLLVPLGDGCQVYHLARECTLETILVVPNRVGCINDSLLNYHFLWNESLQFAGFALNNHYAPTPRIIEQNRSMIHTFMPGSLRWEFDAEQISETEV